MKIAVLGCGSIGTRHIRNLIALGIPARDITGWDLNPGALAGLPDGVQRGPSLEGPDALLICTPATARPLRMTSAIERRVGVFIEKPPALSLAELPDNLIQSFGERPHLVGYNLRFHPQAQLLRGWHESAVGTFTIACDMRTWPGTNYASALWECSHEIDLAQFALGPIARLAAASSRDDRWVLKLDHENGCESTVTIVPDAPAYRREWSVRDASCRYAWSFDAPEDLGNDMYLDEMRHFLRVVRGEESSLNTLAEARRVVAICEQAEALVGA